MRARKHTRFHAIAQRLLVAALVPLSMACGESRLLEPSWLSQLPPAPPVFDFVYVADAQGKVLGRLAEGGWPSWSPDGRRIAFHRDGHIRVIGADGANEVDLAVGQWPTWSPDGRIAFSTGEGISVINSDGLGYRTLMSPTLVTLHDWGVGKPSWSPDGALILFDEPSAYADGFHAGIFAMTADGTSQYELGGFSYYETEPSWSPDGSRVVYWSLGLGLGIVDRGGGRFPQPLTAESARFSARPAWSPDGRAILFNGASAPTAVMTISPDGGSARVLIAQGSDAAWSPDGTRIAFVKRAER